MALSPARARLSELFALAILSFAALRSGRHIPILAIFAAPLFAKYINSLDQLAKQATKSLYDQQQQQGHTYSQSSFTPSADVLDCAKDRRFQFEGSFLLKHKNFRQAPVEYIAKQEALGRIFTITNGVVISSGNSIPKEKFHRGRADVYGDGFVFEYLRTYGGERGWRETLDRI
jgi:hypothetical protein